MPASPDQILIRLSLFYNLKRSNCFILLDLGLPRLWSTQLRVPHNDGQFKFGRATKLVLSYLLPAVITAQGDRSKSPFV
jgi:hypothetical protein